MSNLRARSTNLRALGPARASSAYRCTEARPEYAHVKSSGRTTQAREGFACLARKIDLSARETLASTSAGLALRLSEATTGCPSPPGREGISPVRRIDSGRAPTPDRDFAFRTAASGYPLVDGSRPDRV